MINYDDLVASGTGRCQSDAAGAEFVLMKVGNFDGLAWLEVFEAIAQLVGTDPEAVDGKEFVARVNACLVGG